MSVYIKGMTIPPEGEYRMTLYVCSDGSAYIDVASFPVDEDRFDAIPVPDHGRLIDADALPTYDKPIGKMMMFGGEYVYTQTAIDNVPTIIPASGGTDNE